MKSKIIDEKKIRVSVEPGSFEEEEHVNKRRQVQNLFKNNQKSVFDDPPSDTK